VTYGALAARLRHELDELARVVQRVQARADAARRQPEEEAYLEGTAFNVHAFYTGVEHMLEDIARTVDGELPSGGDWHRRLLVQMAAEIPDVRPPVLSAETYACLDALRTFRHVIRNVYTFNLDAERVLALAEQVPRCFETLRADLEAFLDVLTRIGEET